MACLSSMHLWQIVETVPALIRVAYLEIYNRGHSSGFFWHRVGLLCITYVNLFSLRNADYAESIEIQYFFHTVNINVKCFVRWLVLGESFSNLCSWSSKFLVKIKKKKLLTSDLRNIGGWRILPLFLWCQYCHLNK